MIRKFMKSIKYLLLVVSVYLCMTAALVAADAFITDNAGANAVNSTLRSQLNDKNQSEIVEIATNDSLFSSLDRSSQESLVKTVGLSKAEGQLVLMSGTNTRLTVQSTDNLTTGDPNPSYLNAGDNATETAENSSAQKGSATNATEISEMFDVNTTSSQNTKKAEIAAYVYNDDDDSLDVSLYIDSVPRGKADVSKGEEDTFGNFTLSYGTHRFKIIWKDEDTEKVYESEVKKEITGDDAVSLYTIGHSEPEKYDLTVSVKNEIDKSTNAYLYIDGIYEDNKEISEASTDEFSSASVEEGVHEISVRWLDPYTNDQYEKKKTITIEGGSSVVFIASKGTSFQDLGKMTDPTENIASSQTSYSSSYSTTSNAYGTLAASESENGRRTYNYNIMENANKSIANSTGDGAWDSTDNLSTYDNVVVDGLAGSEGAESENTGTQDAAKIGGPYSLQTLSSIEGLSGIDAKTKDAGWSNISIIYPIVLFAAAYLVFRH